MAVGKSGAVGKRNQTGAAMTDDTTAKARGTKAGKLEALRKKQGQLKAKIAELEAREKAAERKKDARRKIIVGGAVLAHAALDPAFAAELRRVLKMAVTRESDRETIKDFFD